MQIYGFLINFFSFLLKNIKNIGIVKNLLIYLLFIYIELLSIFLTKTPMMKSHIRTTGKRLLLTCFFLSILSPVWSQDKLMDILKTELQREKKAFDASSQPAYYISLRAEDTKRQTISTTFGALVESGENHIRQVAPSIRLGSYQFDNFHPEGNRFMMRTYPPRIPFDDNALAISQAVWSALDDCYRNSVSAFGMIRARQGLSVASEDKSPDFSKADVVKYFEQPLNDKQTRFDRSKWEVRLRKYSAMFLKDSHITSSTANLIFNVTRKYYLDTDGTETVENVTSANVQIYGSVKADDGMDLPLYLSYFSYTPEGLPDDKSIENDVQKLLDKLIRIRTAPVVAPFTGPAILLGSASSVFFHEIFGHRIEGQPMRSINDSRTFKKKVGEDILPSSFSVFMDPTLKNYKEQDLNGHYTIDDQGVRGERVTVVENGKLRNFLMTRTPIDGFPRSNGHARGELGIEVTSRQSNLIVESSDVKTDEQLRKMLISEIKAQGKEFGYIFASVTNGYTFTSTGSPNSFNVTPVEVYRVYPDGRPDELVRGVDLIGTPLSMFSQIMGAGGKSETFTGICGASSGSVPVSAISPSILVKQVEMQSKGKSQETPPILPRPGISNIDKN
jgi:TldD protein